MAAKPAFFRVVLTVLWLMAALRLSYLTVPLQNHFDWLDGYRLTNWGTLAPLLAVLWGVVLVMPSVICLVLCLRIQPRKTYVHHAAIAGVLIYAPLAFLLFSGPLEQEGFIEGWIARLEEEVDPNALQEWAVGELTVNTSAMLSNGRPQAEHLEAPACFASFSSHVSSVSVNMFGDLIDQQHVGIFLGGGFRHWGVLVGPKDFTPDPSKFFYFVKWKDGIYAFYFLT